MIHIPTTELRHVLAAVGKSGVTAESLRSGLPVTFRGLTIGYDSTDDQYCFTYDGVTLHFTEREITAFVDECKKGENAYRTVAVS